MSNAKEKVTDSIRTSIGKVFGRTLKTDDLVDRIMADLLEKPTTINAVADWVEREMGPVTKVEYEQAEDGKPPVNMWDTIRLTLAAHNRSDHTFRHESDRALASEIVNVMSEPVNEKHLIDFVGEVSDKVRPTNETEIELHKEVTILGVDSFTTRYDGVAHSVILDRMGPVSGNQPTAFKVEADEDIVEHIRDDLRTKRKGRLVLHLEPIK